MSVRVLDVGQCGPDHQRIAHFLNRHFSVAVEAADTAEEAVRKVRESSYALVLVNRILDLDGSSGLELVRRLKGHAETGGTPVMLVSNYPEAQDQAVAAGGAPGFGKAELDRSETLQRLEPFLASATA